MTNKTNTLIFWDVGFDKGEMRGAIGCYFMADSMNKAENLAQQFLTTGFPAATNVAQSMGIDDISPPISKQPYASDVIRSLRRNLKRSEQGLINPVFAIQSKLSLWQEVHETLKKMIVAQFQNQDFGNPVFVMAFSGARGNISQVRQLATMRGFMTDAEGNVVDYPIRSCFREGLTLTEYVISCFGARKGLVDTAVRTATAGYLTRRLVDVAQAITVSTFDCGTQNGILITDLQENSKVLLGLRDRLLGRVLAEDILVPQISKQGDTKALPTFGENETEKEDLPLSKFLGNENDKKKNIVLRNTYISRVLAARVAKTKPYVLIRSPLSCRASKSVCQLCYGWSLAYGRAALIGEVVGIIAAQSIGEPGTQLTMRTFHTGGVFAGIGSIWEALPAPITGKILLPGNPLSGRLCYNAAGELSYLLTTTGVIGILGNKKRCWWMVCPPASQLFVRQGEIVRAGQKILEWPADNWTNCVAHLLENRDKVIPVQRQKQRVLRSQFLTFFNPFSAKDPSKKHRGNYFCSKRQPLSQRWLTIRAPENGRLSYSSSKLFVQTVFFKKAKKPSVTDTAGASLALFKALKGIKNKPEITDTAARATEKRQKQLGERECTEAFPPSKNNLFRRFISSHSGYLQFQGLKKNSQSKDLSFLGRKSLERGKSIRDQSILDREFKEDTVLLLAFQSGTVLCAQPGQKVKKGELLAFLPLHPWMQISQTQPKQSNSLLLTKRFTLTKQKKSSKQPLNKKAREKDQRQRNKSVDRRAKKSNTSNQQPKTTSEIENPEKDWLESVKHELPVVVSIDRFSSTGNFLGKNSKKTSAAGAKKFGKTNLLNKNSYRNLFARKELQKLFCLNHYSDKLSFQTGSASLAKRFKKFRFSGKEQGFKRSHVENKKLPLATIPGKDFFANQPNPLRNTFERNTNLMGVLVQLVLFQKPKPRWWASIEVHIEGCLLLEARPIAKLRSPHLPRWFWASKRLRSPREQSRQGDLIDSTSPLNLSAITYPGWSRMSGFLESTTKKLVATSFGCPSLYWPVESIHYMPFGYVLESKVALNKKAVPQERKYFEQIRLKSFKDRKTFSLHLDDGLTFSKNSFFSIQHRPTGPGTAAKAAASTNFSVKRFSKSWYTSIQPLSKTKPVRFILGNSLRSNWPFWKETQKRFNLQLFPLTCFFLGGSVLHISPFQKEVLVQFSENRFSNRRFPTNKKECWLPNSATVAYTTSRQGVLSPLALSQASTIQLGFVKKDFYNLSEQSSSQKNFQKIPWSIFEDSFISNRKKFSDKLKNSICQTKIRFLGRDQFSFKTMKQWFKKEDRSKFALLEILSPKKVFLNTKPPITQKSSPIRSQQRFSQTEIMAKTLSEQSSSQKRGSFCKSGDLKKLSHYKTISRNGSLRRVLVKHPPSFYEVATGLLKKRVFEETESLRKQKNQISFPKPATGQKRLEKNHDFFQVFKKPIQRQVEQKAKEAKKSLATGTKIFLPLLEYPFSVKSKRLFYAFPHKTDNKNKPILINPDWSSEKKLECDNKNIKAAKSWKGLTHLFCFLKKTKQPLNRPLAFGNWHLAFAAAFAAVPGPGQKDSTGTAAIEKTPPATGPKRLEKNHNFFQPIQRQVEQKWERLEKADGDKCKKGPGKPLAAVLVGQKERAQFLTPETNFFRPQAGRDRSFSELFLSSAQLLLGVRSRLLLKRFKDSHSKISPFLRGGIEKDFRLSYFREIKKQELAKAKAVNHLRKHVFSTTKSPSLAKTHTSDQLNDIKTIPGWFYLPLSPKKRSLTSQSTAFAKMKVVQGAVTDNLVDTGTNILTSSSPKKHKSRKTYFSSLCIKEDIPLQAHMVFVSKVTNFNTSLCFQKLLVSKKHLKKLRVFNWRYQTEYRLLKKKKSLLVEKRICSKGFKLAPLLIRRAKEYSRWWFSNPRLFKKGFLRGDLSRSLDQTLVSNTFSSQRIKNKCSLLVYCQPKQRLSAFDNELIQTVPIRIEDDFGLLKPSKTTKQILTRRVLASKVKNKLSIVKGNLSIGSRVKNKIEAGNLLKKKRKFPLPWGTEFNFLPFSTSLLKAFVQGSALASILENGPLNIKVSAKAFNKKPAQPLKKEAFSAFNNKDPERPFALGPVEKNHDFFQQRQRFLYEQWEKAAATVPVHRQGLSSHPKKFWQLSNFKLFLEQRERVAALLYKRRRLVYSNQQSIFGFSVTFLVSENMPTLPPKNTVIKFGLAPHNCSRLLKHAFPLKKDSFGIKNISCSSNALLGDFSLKELLIKPLYNLYDKKLHFFGTGTAASESFARKKFKKVETCLAIPSGMLLQFQDPPLGRDFIKQSFILPAVQSFSKTKIQQIQVALMPFEGEWINRLKYATLASSGNFQIISRFRKDKTCLPSGQKSTDTAGASLALFSDKSFSRSFKKTLKATTALSQQSFSQWSKVFYKADEGDLSQITNQTYSLANQREIPLNWLIFKENKDKATFKAGESFSFNSFKSHVLSDSLWSNKKELSVKEKNRYSDTFNKANFKGFPYNLDSIETNKELYVGGLLESEKSYPKFSKKGSHLWRIKKNGVLVQREASKAIFQPCSSFPASVWNRLSLEQRQQGFLGEGQWLRVASFGRLTSEDITQGIPKVEQLFEARRRGQAMPMWVALSVMFRFLRQRYSVEEALNKSGPAVGVLLMEAIQRIYLSQGVLIADKHFEIVLKPVTNKLRIALFPNLRPALVKAKVRPLFAYVSAETLTGFAHARNLAYSQKFPLSWLPKQPSYYRSVLGNALSGFAKPTISYLSPSSLGNQLVNEPIFTTQSYWKSYSAASANVHDKSTLHKVIQRQMQKGSLKNSSFVLARSQETRESFVTKDLRAVFPKEKSYNNNVSAAFYYKQQRLPKTLQTNYQQLKGSPNSWFSKMLLKDFSTNNHQQSSDRFSGKCKKDPKIFSQPAIRPIQPQVEQKVEQKVQAEKVGEGLLVRETTTIKHKAKANITGSLAVKWQEQRKHILERSYAENKALKSAPKLLLTFQSNAQWWFLQLVNNFTEIPANPEIDSYDDLATEVWRPCLVGVTRAALGVESFLSSASFQETSRVLARSARVGRTDFLRGIKERVLIGVQLLAGTYLVNMANYTSSTLNSVDSRQIVINNQLDLSEEKDFMGNKDLHFRPNNVNNSILITSTIKQLQKHRFSGPQHGFQTKFSLNHNAFCQKLINTVRQAKGERPLTDEEFSDWVNRPIS